MSRILLVEDTHIFGKFICTKVAQSHNIPIDWALSMAQAKEFIKQYKDQYILALLDLGLPDAPRGEIVPYILDQDIPTAVFTGSYNKERKEKLLAAGIIDYIIKDSPISLEYVISFIDRIIKNRQIKAMIIGGDKSEQKQIKSVLSLMQIQSVMVNAERDSMALLTQQDNFGLIIIADGMTDGSPFTTLTAIRGKKRFSHVPIIAIENSDQIDGSRFLKYGASDFIRAPFNPSDLQTRIQNSLRLYDQMQMLEFTASYDYLTGALNRRAFFSRAKSLFALRDRQSLTLTLAMFDIDHFKNINDTYGHDIGDIAIKSLAQHLKTHSRDTDLVARFGGEEFCVLYVNMDADTMPQIFEKLRASIADMRIPVDDGNDEISKTIQFTVSAGVVLTTGDTIDTMIKKADEALYVSKTSGRDKVTFGTK